jgi:hypothetical protein
MKEINNVMYVIGFIMTFCHLVTFAEDEPDFGVVILFYWLLTFVWGYYQEFRKPKDERSYHIIAGSIGFMLGLAIPLIDGAGFGGSLVGGVLGLVLFLALWGVIAYNLKDRYPFLMPKPPQKPSDEADLYDDIGGEGEA